jgi:hypothetical protein
VVNNDESDQAVVEQPTIDLLSFKPLSHFIKTTLEIKWHVQWITHKIH